MSEAKWKSITLRTNQQQGFIPHMPRHNALPLAGKPMDLDEIFEEYRRTQARVVQATSKTRKE